MDEILAGKDSMLRIHLAGRCHPKNQKITAVSCSVRSWADSVLRVYERRFHAKAGSDFAPSRVGLIGNQGIDPRS
jgi:hypothetical protein